MNAAPGRLLLALMLSAVLGLTGALGVSAQTAPSCTGAGAGSGGSQAVCQANLSITAATQLDDDHDNGRNHGDRDDRQCPNGQVRINGVCQTGTQYCNGQFLPPGGTCYPYCPTGQFGAIGQSCLNGVTVTYPAGWNIVAGPTGTVLPNVASPLYSFPPGVSAYVSMPGSSPLQAGTGYWAFFNTSTTATLPPATANTVTVQLTPNVYTLIGNPGTSTATVSGTALSVLTYNPSGGGYTPATQLQPGQGAWVASPVGGTVTITSGVSPFQPPAPPPPLAP